MSPKEKLEEIERAINWARVHGTPTEIRQHLERSHNLLREFIEVDLPALLITSPNP